MPLMKKQAVQNLLMAGLLNTQRRALSFFPCRFCKSNAHDLPQFPSPLRYYSSDHNKNQCNDDDDELDRNAKPKSPAKSKTAISMAQLINSKQWSTDLESTLSSLSPSLSKTTFFQTLRRIKSPSRALYFFNWARQIGFAHDDQSYFLMLEILGRTRNLNAARNLLLSIEKKSNGSVKLEDRFFNSLIRSYGQAGLFQESLKLFAMMKTIGISPSVITFNSLLSILLKRGRTNMAASLFDEMLNTYGVTPDVYTFNILIRGFCKNSMVDQGFRYFQMMSRFKCDPDVITYNTLVDGLCRAGKVKTAHNVVKGMSRKSNDLNPNIVSYTTLIRGYCMKQEIDQAAVVFNEMISQGMKPNRITYNTLIKGLCEAQKVDRIKEILEGTTDDRDFTPDTCTFNTLIDAHCSTQNLDGALKAFEEMSKLQVQPDSATYSVLIRTLCQKGNFDRAEELFDELAEKEILLSDVGCTPLVAAYNPIFNYLCGNGKTEKAERVFRQLMRRGTQDPVSCKILIMGHCKQGSFRAGLELLVLMLRRNFVPDFETYESLIMGLVKMGEAILASQTLEKMLKSSHLPEATIFHSIVSELLKKGHASESFCLIKLMLEKRIRQNMSLSTHTVKLLFGGGLQDKAFQIVGLLYENGYMVAMEELIEFLCQRRKLLYACKLLLFSLRKHQSVDIRKCNIVIEGLCKINEVSEAFELYYELVEKGLHHQLSCPGDLKVALEAHGRSNEAEFVSKRMPKVVLV